MEELKRILLVKKTAAAADIMDLQEIEEKVDFYGYSTQMHHMS